MTVKYRLSTQTFLDIHNETGTDRTTFCHPPQLLTLKSSIHSQYPHPLMGRRAILLSSGNILSNICSISWLYNMERLRCHCYIFIVSDLLPRGQCFLPYIRLSLAKGTTLVWTVICSKLNYIWGCLSLSCIRLFRHNRPHCWVVLSLNILRIFLWFPCSSILPCRHNHCRFM